MPRRIQIIANPIAGGRARRRIDSACAWLRSQGCGVELILTRARGDAEQAAARARHADIDLLIAAGGDGTLNEVINGLAPSEVPLAFLPLGTTNVFALEADLPLEIEAACAVALGGTAKPVSLGRIGDRRFLLMAGIGFDGEVVKNASTRFKRFGGKLAYVGSGLINFIRYGYPEFEAECADGKVHRIYGAVVANARCYGGRFTLTPGASLADDTLEVFLLKKRGRLALLRCIWCMLRGLSPAPDPGELVRTRQLKVRGAPAPIQIDGDYFGTLPVELGVDFGAIRMVFPATSSPESVHA